MGVESYGVEFSWDELLHTSNREHVDGDVDGALFALKNEVGPEMWQDSVWRYWFVPYGWHGVEFAQDEAEYVEG